MAKLSVTNRAGVRDIEAAAVFMRGRDHETERYTELNFTPAALQTREIPLSNKIMLPAKSPKQQ